MIFAIFYFLIGFLWSSYIKWKVRQVFYIDGLSFRATMFNLLLWPIALILACFKLIVK